MTNPIMKIERTATLARERQLPEQRALPDWDDLPAYVLLGEPGGGKTTVFCEAVGRKAGIVLNARKLLNAPDAAWRGQTLFIDAFDVVRAGAGAGTPMAAMDKLAKALTKLGKPRFRLACRELEWLRSDQKALNDVAPGGQVEVLQLDPLSPIDQRRLLSAHGVADPGAFLRTATAQRLDAMLGNPLLLMMLVEAVGPDQHWPHHRQQVFDQACRQMAAEHNDDLLDANSRQAGDDIDTLQDAGMLCAQFLLAGLEGWARYPVKGRSAANMPSLKSLTDLCQYEPDWAVRTKLFVRDGELIVPRHRSIAAYLAAMALAERIERHGLPVNRVLAWLVGADGGIVEPLRELAGWLCALSPSARAVLIVRDPLGCLVYGDATAFEDADCRALLLSLREAADAFPHFRHAGSEWGRIPQHAFGALARPALLPKLKAVLNSTERSAAHDAHLDCVIDALRHGARLPALLPQLERLLREPRTDDEIRVSALAAWLTIAESKHPTALDLLKDVASTRIPDIDDRLLGTLLDSLYPEVVTPHEVMLYFKPRAFSGPFGDYARFWEGLVARTPRSAHALLADDLVAASLDKKLIWSDFSARRQVLALLLAALQVDGATATPNRLAGWLALATDDHGNALLEDTDEGRGIRDWLIRHGDAREAAYRDRLSTAEACGEPDRSSLQRCADILLGTPNPSNWPLTLLDIAAGAKSTALARHAFSAATRTALMGHGQFGLDQPSLKAWVDAQAERWPLASAWLAELQAGCSQWRRELLLSSRQNKSYELKAQRLVRRGTRLDRQRLQAGHLPSPWFLNRVAQAIELSRNRPAPEGGTDPVDALRKHLHLDLVEGRAALAALLASPLRPDLPEDDEVLRKSLNGGRYFLQSPCLLAAELRHSQSPGTAHAGWSEAQTRTLLAFELVANGAANATWLRSLVADKPQLVASMLLADVEPRLRSGDLACTMELWSLYRNDALAPIAPLLLPTLMASMPQRLSPQRFKKLGVPLLNAALRHMDASAVQALATQQLALPWKLTSATQRMAWLLISMLRAPRQRLPELAKLIANHAGRRHRLMRLLDGYSSHSLALALPVAARAGLIRLLGPHADPSQQARPVEPSDVVREAMRNLFAGLGAADGDDADDELQHIADDPTLTAWHAQARYIRHERRRRLRNQQHTYPSAEVVAQGLIGGCCVNTQDMAALLLDLLADLQRDLRDREGQALDEFWHDADPDGKRTPRLENDCRNRLAERLRPRLLHYSISLAPESEHANQRRADLNLRCFVQQRELRLPVEIKREDNETLWTAPETQLADYARHPDASGVGVYLVLWFGRGVYSVGRRQARPQSPVELQTQITATLPADLKRRLTVWVMDLSRPQPLHSTQSRNAQPE